METILLFIAGLVGGTMNALAGGGSGITFAALVFTGMPPIIANATNTFAATFGYITGVIGYRKHMVGYWRDLDVANAAGLYRRADWRLGIAANRPAAISRLPCRGCFYWQRCCSWPGRKLNAPPHNWAERG